MMHSANDKDDILIHLGQHPRSSSYSSEEKIIDFEYNVTKFLSRHDSNTFLRNRIANADKFIHLLDAKVYVESSAPKYSHIYQGIDKIINHVVLELTKLDDFFAEVKLRQTGSSMSGVKVGLPHEADYVMILPKDKRLKTGVSFDEETLITLVQHIVADQAVELTKGLANWVVHGVKEYGKTGGVCLVMQCCATANDPTSEEVGVTVDLIPGYIQEVVPEHIAFNKKAKAFLPYSLEEYAEKGEVYMLIDKSEYDTGFIENCILERLPENTKRAYRDAKFLNSHIASPEIPFEEIESLDEETRLRLYGHKPLVSSYLLRVLFLHLLLHVHDTEAEKRVTGGLLCLCLLDMLEYCMLDMDPMRDLFIMNHPFMNHPLLLAVIFPSKPIKRIKRFFVTYYQPYVVSRFCLLNNTSKVHDFDDEDDDYYHDDDDVYDNDNNEYCNYDLN